MKENIYGNETYNDTEHIFYKEAIIMGFIDRSIVCVINSIYFLII
jgi:hypothetical protein